MGWPGLPQPARAIREATPQARDFTNRRYRYKDRIDAVGRPKKKTKSQVRAKVERVFAVIKLKFASPRWATAPWTRTRIGCS